MNTERKKYLPKLSGIAVQLWGIMMLLVILTAAFMWGFQIYFMENNYVNSNVQEVQAQLDSVLEELAVEDLAENERLISYLTDAARGKMMIVDQDGQLAALYSYDYPIDLEDHLSDIQIWNQITESAEYQSVLKRIPYTREHRKRNRIYAYETGVPVTYHDQDAYLILYRSFNELYNVLDMNRQQMVALSILLTLAASILAAFLARRYTKPILAIKKTVDLLAKGDLNASPGLTQKDEIGQLADSVEKLGKSLQKVDVLRKEVIANVSHELRSPLALIAGYAEMVRDITWKDQDKRQEDLGLIISEAQRMSRMVDDILDYSQLQAGYLQLNMGEYDLCEIVETEVSLYEQITAENHLILRLERPEEECMVEADALKLSQVIRNLLNNAVNHTPDGGNITVSVLLTVGGYKVIVSNPGEPISKEDQELIWERYQRSQHQGARRQGTGIGLSIVSTILKAHGISYGVDCDGGLICFWFLCKGICSPTSD